MIVNDDDKSYYNKKLLNRLHPSIYYGRHNLIGS